ncbi:MAG: alpha/beta hydrolase, partial [Clostridiales bacterium]|nr:alpha/beta hydrolase [Clostridiales bacterium]
MESLQIKAENGEKLKANLILPEKSNSRVIIACHGARSSGLGEFRFMADYFKKGGYTVLLPEHRGCGHSDGKYMGYGTNESADTLLWLDYAKKRFSGYSVFLMGVSMGAATVLMMSDKIKDNSVCGIVADCSYTSAWDEFSYQLKTSFHLPDFPVLYICDLYCKIFCGYSFKDAAPIKSVKNTSIPILFIHGKSDDYVPFYMQKQLYDSCSSEKYILPVDGAVHARSYYTNPEVYEKSINAFFDKYDKG